MPFCPSRVSHFGESPRNSRVICTKPINSEFGWMRSQVQLVWILPVVKDHGDVEPLIVMGIKKSIVGCDLAFAKARFPQRFFIDLWCP